MTLLGRPIRRELPGLIDRRRQVALISPAGVQFRVIRSRRPLPLVPWAAIYQTACLIAADERRAERAAARRKKDR